MTRADLALENLEANTFILLRTIVLIFTINVATSCRATKLSVWQIKIKIRFKNPNTEVADARDSINKINTNNK